MPDQVGNTLPVVLAGIVHRVVLRLDSIVAERRVGVLLEYAPKRCGFLSHADFGIARGRDMEQRRARIDAGHLCLS